MRSIRVIPCLDINQGRVVKGVNFLELRDQGDPVELAQYYNDEGADELVFLDVSASHEGRPLVADLADRVSEKVFIPFTVGGGLRTVNDIRQALLAGADKVSLNTAAVQNPDLIAQGADQFGSQCIVLAIDAKHREGSEGWEVVVHGGRTRTGMDVVEWATTATRLGAGEILLTSMDGDGTLAGYDIPLTRAVASAVDVPVIASGGAGKPEHLVEAVQQGQADAVLIASIVHDRTYRLDELKQALQNAGIPVRRPGLA